MVPGHSRMEPRTRPLGISARRAVTVDITFLEVDDRLGNFRGVICNSLDVSRGVDEAKPCVDPFRMCDDLLLEQLEHGSVVAIDSFLIGHDRLCPVDIGLGQGVKAVVYLLQGFESKVFQRLRDRQSLGICGQFLDPLGDMSRKVSHPFEIAVDLENNRDPSEVGGHGLVQGEHANALTLDLNFPVVNGRLLMLDLIGQFNPAVTQGVNALVQGLFDDRGELENLGPEALHIADEMAADREPLLTPVPWGRPDCVVFLHQTDPRLQGESGSIEDASLVHSS